MSENFKKFLEIVSKDEALKQKVLAFKDMEKEDTIRAAIALAKELGIELTEADFSEKEANNELTDDELDAVAGGNVCGCPLVGSGGGTDSRDGRTYACSCIGKGQGGDGREDDLNCSCTAVGTGTDYGIH